MNDRLIAIFNFDEHQRDKIAPVVTYIIVALSCHSLTTLPFFLFIKL